MVKIFRKEGWDLNPNDKVVDGVKVDSVVVFKKQ